MRAVQQPSGDDHREQDPERQRLHATEVHVRCCAGCCLRLELRRSAVAPLLSGGAHVEGLDKQARDNEGRLGERMRDRGDRGPAELRAGMAHMDVVTLVFVIVKYTCAIGRIFPIIFTGFSLFLRNFLSPPMADRHTVLKFRIVCYVKFKVDTLQICLLCIVSIMLSKHIQK